MKIGDILINRWAGHIDCKYFIYLGITGEYLSGLEYINSKWEKVRYYKRDLDTLIKNKEKAFEVVGHTNFLDIAKVDLDFYKLKEVKSEAVNRKL